MGGLPAVNSAYVNDKFRNSGMVCSLDHPVVYGASGFVRRNLVDDGVWLLEAWPRYRARRLWTCGLMRRLMRRLMWLDGHGYDI